MNPLTCPRCGHDLNRFPPGRDGSLQSPRASLLRGAGLVYVTVHATVWACTGCEFLTTSLASVSVDFEQQVRR